MTTDQSDLFRTFVSEYQVDFKKAGFRKKGATFNRAVNDVVQVISFERKRLRGFSVDDPDAWFFLGRAGVAMPFDLLGPTASDRFVREVSCHIRADLAQLGGSTGGYWDLRELDIARRELSAGLDALAGVFDSFNTIDRVLESAAPFGLSDVAGLEVLNSWRAIVIRVWRGEKDLAQAQLDVHVAKGPLNRGHYRHLTEFAEANGLTVTHELVRVLE